MSPHPVMSSSVVEDIIRGRIRESGGITFAEFMETALYAPVVGYYRGENRVSTQGDFFTSPSVHPAFGALIGIQLHQIWELLNRPEPFYVIELGAGSGKLRRDVLRSAKLLDSDFLRAITYIAYDRAFLDGREGQRDPRFPASRGTRTSDTKEARDIFPDPHPGHQDAAMPREPAVPAGITGCVLSNELLDAFPVHRFRIDGGELKELYVVEREGRLEEEPAAPSTPALARRLSDVQPDLPEGFRGEVNLEIDRWAERVSGILHRGCVLTIDFGYPRTELYAPDRRAGTLRCYYRHTLSMNPFQHIGDQDMAAHVDFTAVDEAMEAQGFKRGPVTTQREFLLRLGLSSFLDRLIREARSQEGLDRERMALLELVKPDGLGNFRVAAHTKALQHERLMGFCDAAENPLDLRLYVDGISRIYESLR